MRSDSCLRRCLARAATIAIRNVRSALAMSEVVRSPNGYIEVKATLRESAPVWIFRLGAGELSRPRCRAILLVGGR